MDTRKTNTEVLLQRINTLGMEPSGTLASDLGVEPYHPTVSMLGGAEASEREKYRSTMGVRISNKGRTLEVRSQCFLLTCSLLTFL